MNLILAGYTSSQFMWRRLEQPQDSLVDAVTSNLGHWPSLILHERALKPRHDQGSTKVNRSICIFLIPSLHTTLHSSSSAQSRRSSLNCDSRCIQVHTKPSPHTSSTSSRLPISLWKRHDEICFSPSQPVAVATPVVVSHRGPVCEEGRRLALSSNRPRLFHHRPERLMRTRILVATNRLSIAKI
jgi:hypothetical protein